MSELLCLGISHKTAPVALRERLALTDTRAPSAFCASSSPATDVSEAVAISTCNRTEVYVVVGDPVAAETRVLGLLARSARASARPSWPRRSTRRATATPPASSTASPAAWSR